MSEQKWRVIEVHGEWTDDEYDRAFTLIADRAHSRRFPSKTDPYVSGTTLREPPEWARPDPEVEADIAEGRVTTFAGTDEFLASLDPEDGE